MIKKKRENPKPEHPSSVAVVVLGSRCWYYHTQGKSQYGSVGYKTQEHAIKAALAIGYRTVKVDGKVVAQIKKEPKEATDGKQEEVVDESAQEAAEDGDPRAGV